MPSRKRQRLETPELLPLMDPSANSPSSPETPVSRKSMDVFKIPDDIAQKSVNGVNALMRKLELDKASTPASLVGSKPIVLNTVKSYEKHFKGSFKTFTNIMYRTSVLLQYDWRL